MQYATPLPVLTMNLLLFRMLIKLSWLIKGRRTWTSAMIQGLLSLHQRVGLAIILHSYPFYTKCIQTLPAM